MKKTLLSILGLLCFMVMQAQVAKTVNMTQAGALDGLLSANEKNTITDLILTGPIDARDFKTMRDLMPVLAVLDMEGANIEECGILYPANQIPSEAFYFNIISKNTLKTVKLPSGVTSIGNSAFQFCSGLRSIEFSAGLVSIGDNAFKGCIALTGELNLPASLISIGDHAFSNCRSLTGAINIPAGVKIIGISAFQYCSGFTAEIKLPAGVKIIGSNAFSFCSGLTSIRSDAQMPPDVRDDTFMATNIKIAFVPTGSKAAYESAGIWKNYIIIDEEKAYTLHIPIRGTLGSTLESAGGEANNVTSLKLTGELNSDDFLLIRDNMPSLHTINMDGLLNKTIPDNAFKNKATLINIVLPSGLTSIGRSAFYSCKLTGKLHLPAGITSIGESAFKDCSSLTGKLNLPAGITSIDSAAFSGCEGLTGIEFPSGITSIGSWAFQYCRRLAGELNLPASITSIGSFAFSGCSSLTGELNLPAGIESIRDHAFFSCSGLTGIKFPVGITSIGRSAFQHCSSLTGQLKLPAALTSIEDYAFSECCGLTGIVFPAGLTKIGDCVFLKCSGLISVKLPSELTSIGENTFSGCIDLTDIEFPAALTSIESAAFSGCRKLTDIKFPSGLTKIGDYAFLYCYNVTKITCEAVTPPSIGGSAFSDIDTKTCELHVPQGSVTEYQSAPHWDAFMNIFEMDNPTGIITPEKSIRTWRANGQLFVESTEEMMAAEVVDMSGRRVCSVSKTAYAYVLNMLKKGVYVVRIRTVNGEVKTVKVAM